MRVSLKKYRNSKRPELKWRVLVSDGPRSSDKKFRTRKDAESYFEEKELEISEIGKELSERLDAKTKREVFDVLGRLEPFGKTITEAVDFYIQHLEATEASRPLDELIPEYLHWIRKSGRSKRYESDLSVRLERFKKEFGSRYANEISSRDISEWVISLKVGDQTRNHYRRVVSAFYSWCVANGFSGSNPVEKVAKAKVVSGETGIFTPVEMQTLLNVALGKGERYHDILALVLIGGFAGLRISEIERLDWESVKIDRGFIDLSKGKTKTAQRRIVTLRPVLQEWLTEYFLFSAGPVLLPGYHNRLKDYRQILESSDRKDGMPRVQWKHNGLRHSYASYLLAETENPGEVSLQLGHNNAGIVFKHYRELVTKDEANTFWGLFPKEIKERRIVSIEGA